MVFIMKKDWFVFDMEQESRVSFSPSQHLVLSANRINARLNVLPSTLQPRIILSEMCT